MEMHILTFFIEMSQDFFQKGKNHFPDILLESKKI